MLASTTSIRPGSAETSKYETRYSPTLYLHYLSEKAIPEGILAEQSTDYNNCKIGKYTKRNISIINLYDKLQFNKYLINSNFQLLCFLIKDNLIDDERDLVKLNNFRRPDVQTFEINPGLNKDHIELHVEEIVKLFNIMTFIDNTLIRYVEAKNVETRFYASSKFYDTLYEVKQWIEDDVHIISNRQLEYIDRTIINILNHIWDIIYLIFLLTQWRIEVCCANRQSAFISSHNDECSY